MRVICAGQILEDISDYGRLHQMFHMMKPSEARMNDAIEGFGVSESLVTTLNNADEASTLAKDEKQTICFTPLSGILTQDKLLPCRYCPLQFEVEIVGNANDAVQGSANVGDAKNLTFLIDDVQIKCDGHEWKAEPHLAMPCNRGIPLHRARIWQRRKSK